MNRLFRRWMWLLASVALVACATTLPPVSEGAGDQDESEIVSFEEACRDESSLLALCVGRQCGMYRCREVMAHLKAGQVVRTWGEAEPLAEVGGGAQRYWGSAQELPWDTRPVFVFTAYLRIRLVRPCGALLAPADTANASGIVKAMRFFHLQDVPEPRYSGWHTYGHKWSLPGVHCAACDTTWAGTGNEYPSVDLSQLPAQERQKYSARLEKDYAEFERLCEQVRPLVPPEVRLWPGTRFGPMNGSAQGEFGPLTLAHGWTLLMRREPLERLQAEGLQGLKGYRTELRFRKKNPPELLEVELQPRGEFHPACLPERRPPCPKCGHDYFKLPEAPILDAATLPQDLDLFRLAGFTTMILGTERFVEAVRRLGYAEDLSFRELPVRGA